MSKCKSGSSNSERPLGLSVFVFCTTMANTVQEDDTAFSVSINVRLFQHTQIAFLNISLRFQRQPSMQRFDPRFLFFSLFLFQIAINSCVNTALSCWGEACFRATCYSSASGFSSVSWHNAFGAAIKVLYLASHSFQKVNKNHCSCCEVAVWM